MMKKKAAKEDDTKASRPPHLPLLASPLSSSSSQSFKRAWASDKRHRVPVAVVLFVVAPVDVFVVGNGRVHSFRREVRPSYLWSYGEWARVADTVSFLFFGLYAGAHEVRGLLFR